MKSWWRCGRLSSGVLQLLPTSPTPASSHLRWTKTTSPSRRSGSGRTRRKDEDSAEEIASSDEGEDEEGEEGEDVEPASEAPSQPQHDRASSNEARASAPSAGGGDHAEVHQPATPPAGATVSADLPDTPVAPLA